MNWKLPNLKTLYACNIDAEEPIVEQFEFVEWDKKIYGIVRNYIIAYYKNEKTGVIHLFYELNRKKLCLDRDPSWVYGTTKKEFNNNLDNRLNMLLKEYGEKAEAYVRYKKLLIKMKGEL